MHGIGQSIYTYNIIVPGLPVESTKRVLNRCIYACHDWKHVAILLFVTELPASVKVACTHPSRPPIPCSIQMPLITVYTLMCPESNEISKPKDSHRFRTRLDLLRCMQRRIYMQRLKYSLTATATLSCVCAYTVYVCMKSSHHSHSHRHT